MSNAQHGQIPRIQRKRSPRVKSVLLRRLLRHLLTVARDSPPSRREETNRRTSTKICNSKGSDNNCLHLALVLTERLAVRSRNDRTSTTTHPDLLRKARNYEPERRVKCKEDPALKGRPSPRATSSQSILEQDWKEYVGQDEQTRKYLTRNLDKESWFENYWAPNMKHLLARKKSSSSLRGRQYEPGASEPTFTTPSDQKSRQEKSTQYKHASYRTLLATKGSYTDKDNEGSVKSDYAVGFRREPFTEGQLEKLQPVDCELNDTSYFMATWYMYLPFLTCEVKCSMAAPDIAYRQNALSMTLAVRGPVELFRPVGREKELNPEILASSISHDHTAVRFTAIIQFGFTALEGKDKWTAYSFAKIIQVYSPNPGTLHVTLPSFPLGDGKASCDNLTEPPTRRLQRKSLAIHKAVSYFRHPKETQKWSA